MIAHGKARDNNVTTSVPLLSYYNTHNDVAMRGVSLNVIIAQNNEYNYHLSIVDK